MSSPPPDDGSRARAKTPGALIEMLRAADFSELSREMNQLLAIERWARGQLGLAEGDRVRIRGDWRFPDRASVPGWWGYRECLIPGATARVAAVSFITYQGRGWRVDIQLDQEWSVGEPRAGTEARRYWHGSLESTPKGYMPPSKHNHQHFPEGRRGLFMMRPENLEKIS